MTTGELQAIHAARCPSCRAVTLDGHDPHPLAPLGEALAWVADRPTVTVVRATDGWTLAPRTATEIQAMPPGLCDVLATHVCGAARLPGLASAHAPRGHVTKASLLEVYGPPGGARNARPAKCRCGQWCLSGLDDDVMAFAHLADPWPVDPTYGRAIAGAAGRIVLNVTRKGGHSRFHHPWNPVPYSERVFVSLPTHECGNGLPSIGMPTIEEVVSVNDPWNEDALCPF